MPQRPRSHHLEEESNRAFEASLPSHWVHRRLHPDYGLDYTVEIFRQDGKATGLSFHAQLKGTDEQDLARALAGVRFPRDTADYYRSLPLPVLVVLFHAPSQQLFARWFHAYNPNLAPRDTHRSDAQTTQFQFFDSDLVAKGTSDRIEAGLRGFLRFRSAELELPIGVAVTSTDAEHAYNTAFSLRRVSAQASDIVAFEVREPAPDDPAIVLEATRSVASLADVATVTLHHGPRAGERDRDKEAADLALGLSLCLTYVGQANLAARVASVLAASSNVIEEPEVSLTIAGAMYRSGRVREAIQLADTLDSSEGKERGFAAVVLLTALLATDRLSDDERTLALSTAEQRLERRLARQDDGGAAAEAYSLGMLHKRFRCASSAVASLRLAAQLDDSYLSRAYYHSDLAGALFEHGNYDEAAEHYERAVELGSDDLTVALHADALLFSGRYEVAHRRFEEYLRHNSHPAAAEWRLKHTALSLIIETVGPEQKRQPEQAEELLRDWSFETGPDISLSDAWQACTEAVEFDACGGEAWFRLGLLAVGHREDPQDGAPFATAGAVLKRHSEAAWTNAVLCTGPGDEDTLSDLFFAGYRLCGDRLVQKITDAVRQAEHFKDGSRRVLELLDQAVVYVDDEERRRGFTMRFRAEGGKLEEVVFGPGDEPSASQ